MPELVCDHLAVLVTNLEQALESLGQRAKHAHAIEEFPAEGTREVYVGSGVSMLLLLQPIGEGPYRRALEQRGPGLHHVAFSAPDPTTLLSQLPGWLLHPHSLASQPSTLWACRPGIPLLVELSTGTPSGEPWIPELDVACAPAHAKLLSQLDGPSLRVRPGSQTQLRFADGVWPT